MQQAQYEVILKYMEATGQDYEQAQLSLQQHHYDLPAAVNAAIHSKFAQAVPDQPRDEEIVLKYRRHLERKSREWSLLGAIYSNIKSTVASIFSLGAAIIPGFLLFYLSGNPFWNMYHRFTGATLHRASIDSLLAQTKELSNKCLLLIVTGNHREQCVTQFLGNLELLRGQYLVSGRIEGDQQLKDLPLGPINPQILFLRHNAFEEVVVVGRASGAAEIEKINGDLLRRNIVDSNNLHKRDCNVLIKFRNYINTLYYGGQYHYEDEEEEINVVERKRTLSEVIQQNEQFQKAKAENARAKKEAEERENMERKKERQAQLLQQERRCRKQSIPDEPVCGQMIRISFRCPDGSTRVRAFEAEEKVDLLYQWVELNEEIQFQDDKKRSFQILYSYPREPLCSKREARLREVFESGQEKVFIREV